jgi:hypothetical protein
MEANEQILRHKEETATVLAEETFGALSDLLSVCKSALPIDTLLQMHLGNKDRLLALDFIRIKVFVRFSVAASDFQPEGYAVHTTFPWPNAKCPLRCSAAHP